MIDLEDGMTLCGRCTLGFAVGFITKIKRETYKIRWLDGAVTTQLRPGEDEQIFQQAAE